MFLAAGWFRLHHSPEILQNWAVLLLLIISQASQLREVVSLQKLSSLLLLRALRPLRLRVAHRGGRLREGGVKGVVRASREYLGVEVRFQVRV